LTLPFVLAENLGDLVKHFLPLPIFLALLVGWTRSVQPQTRVDRNVVYGMYSGLALLLDVHHPDRPNGYGIVCIAGSGWNAPLGYDALPLKEETELDDWANRLMAAGYTLFFVNHRSSPRFIYPAAVEDLQRAVRFVRAHSAIYAIHPDQIGALGASSGGHLASMLGVLDGTGDPESPDPINRFSSKVQSVVALYAPFDLKRLTTARGGPAVALFVGVRNLLKDDTPHGTPEYQRYTAASPITYVTSDDAPFLLLQGDVDPAVPVEQSQLMEAALKKAGVPVKLDLVAGGGHDNNFGLSSDDPRLRTYLTEAVKWFDSHLRKDSN
jgi:acetyl esterase/lipase